jgi:hypothetical protein
LTPLSGLADSFSDKTPLWTYVLAEAHLTSWAAHPEIEKKEDIPIRLGPVGGRIVAEVFGALLVGDPASYLHAEPRFTPIPEFTHDGTFGLAELIDVALGRPA